MRKTTEQLMAELQNTKNIDDFVVKNQGEMMDMSLSMISKLFRLYTLIP